MAYAGYLDEVRQGMASGWIWNSDQPDVRQRVIIEVDGIEIGRVVADGYRADLLDAGIGDGRFAFMLRWNDTGPAPGLRILTARVEGSGQELPGSPTPYSIPRGGNYLANLPFSLDSAGRPERWAPEDAERVFFELIESDSQPGLRAWAIRPSDGSTVLLQHRLDDPGLSGFELLAVTLEIRAVSGAVPVRLDVLGTGRNGPDSVASSKVEARQNWQRLVLPLKVPSRDRLPEHWTLSLTSLAESPMTGVELRNLRFGSAIVPELKPERVPRAATSPQPPAGGFTASNLLPALRFLDFAVDDKPVLAPAWAADQAVRVEAAQWRPTEDSRLASHAIARIELSRSDRPCRLSCELETLPVVDLAFELLAGGAGIDIAAWIEIDGDVATTPLLPKAGVPSAPALRIGALSLDEAMRRLIDDATQIRLVIEISGQGAALLGWGWLGAAALAGDRSGRTDREEDQARREWHYQRYLETVEAQLPVEAPVAELAAFIRLPSSANGETPELAAALATLRSLLPQVSRLLLCVTACPDGELPDLGAIRQRLASAVSRRRAGKVELAAAADDQVAAACHRAFVGSLPRGWLLVTLEAGDLVRADLARALAAALDERPEASFIAFDHDHLVGGRRGAVALKPGLSAHLLLETDYLGRAVAFRSDALAAQLAAGAASPLDAPNARDAALRLLAAGEPSVKLDMVLLHLGPHPVAPPSYQAQRSFVEAALARDGRGAELAVSGRAVFVKRRPNGSPKVSIIIPFRDKADYLERCVTSIFTRTRYQNFEIVLVDNQSSEAATAALLDRLAADERIVRLGFDQNFNYSKANNFGARQATGEFLVFLNNDVEIVSTDWLETLTGFADLPDTGCVGPRLHYETGAIQHAGVVVGLNGLAGHAFAGEHEVAVPPELVGHTRDVSAVTGAALCIKAERYWMLGGFDERFILTGNDVELCLRARRRGFRNVYVGSVQLFHFERVSRRDIPVFPRDLQLSLETYEPELSAGDPFWNQIASRRRADFLPRAAAEPCAAAARQSAAEKRQRAFEGRALGADTGYILRNDIDRATIARNIALNRAYARNGGCRPRRIAWFVPPVSHIYRGGLYTCFRLAAHLFRAYGAEPLIVTCSEARPNLELLAAQFAEAFPDVPFRIHHHDPIRHAVQSLPNADLGVATLWTTAYILARYECTGKFYLVQDFEPLFESGGAGYGLIETTYRMGFLPICNGAGVSDALAPYQDGPMLTFTPGIDRAQFHPAAEPVSSLGRPVRLAFYGRPNHPRNLFGLGMQALLELKSLYGDDIEIIAAGAEFDPAAHGAAGKIVNAGLLPSIASVAALYRSSDIGVVFMQSRHPSYQPLEFMASGCVTVSNLNEANSWLLRDRHNCLLAPISLTAIVETLAEAVEDADLRLRLRRNALATVAKFDWSDTEERVAQFMLDPIGMHSRSTKAMVAE